MASTEQNASINKQLGYHIGLFQGLTNSSIGAMMLLILYFGGRLVAQEKMTSGELMAYMVATQNVQRSFGRA